MLFDKATTHSCRSWTVQLSQSPLDKRPNYDAVEGANVTPTTFYNIGELEIQDNLARIWYYIYIYIYISGWYKKNYVLLGYTQFCATLFRVDIGTSEPLLLDILINALIQISSEYDFQSQFFMFILINNEVLSLLDEHRAPKIYDFWVLIIVNPEKFTALDSYFCSYIGIKQVMFGGKEFENWNENLKSEDAGFSVHKI